MTRYRDALGRSSDTSTQELSLPPKFKVGDKVRPKDPEMVGYPQRLKTAVSGGGFLTISKVEQWYKGYKYGFFEHGELRDEAIYIRVEKDFYKPEGEDWVGEWQ